MHRAVDLARPSMHHYPVVGLDVFTHEGACVGTADTWNGVITMFATLRSGEYQVIDSTGKTVGNFAVHAQGAATLRILGTRS